MMVAMNFRPIGVFLLLCGACGWAQGPRLVWTANAGPGRCLKNWVKKGKIGQ